MAKNKKMKNEIEKLLFYDIFIENGYGQNAVLGIEK
jgi:hypothetical protein